MEAPRLPRIPPFDMPSTPMEERPALSREYREWTDEGAPVDAPARDGSGVTWGFEFTITCKIGGRTLSRAFIDTNVPNVSPLEAMRCKVEAAFMEIQKAGSK